MTAKRRVEVFTAGYFVGVTSSYNRLLLEHPIIMR